MRSAPSADIELARSFTYNTVKREVMRWLGSTHTAGAIRRIDGIGGSSGRRVVRGDDVL